MNKLLTNTDILPSSNESTNPSLSSTSTSSISLNTSFIKLVGAKSPRFWNVCGGGKSPPSINNKISLYDQATNTVGRGVVCNKCHEKDEIIYQKYKLITKKGKGDPYGMLKIVVDDDDKVNYDIDEMEMWHDDVKEKVSKVGKDK